MLNNLIFAKTKELFTTQLEEGNVLDEAIAFIEDTKEIWNHGTYFDGNKPLKISTESSMTLSPNVYYRNTNTSLSSLTITLDTPTDDTVLNEYFLEFTTNSSSGTTVSFPSSIIWANDETPIIKVNTTYQVSIVNNLGVITSFNKSNGSSD